MVGPDPCGARITAVMHEISCWWNGRCDGVWLTWYTYGCCCHDVLQCVVLKTSGWSPMVCLCVQTSSAIKIRIVKWYMLSIVICSTAIYYKVGWDNTVIAGAMRSNESGPRMPQCWHLTVYLHECVYLLDQTQHRRIVTRGALQIFSVLLGIHYWE